MKILIVYLFTIVNLFPIEVLQAAENKNNVLIKNGKSVDQSLNEENKIVVKDIVPNGIIGRDKLEKTGYVPIKYRPKSTESTKTSETNSGSINGIDPAEMGLSFGTAILNLAGYPSDLSKLSSTTKQTFGRRCDKFLNDGILNLNDSAWKEATKDNEEILNQVYEMMGVGNKENYENRCGPNGEKCACEDDLICQPRDLFAAMLDQTNVQEKVATTCLFRRTCENDNDISPKQACKVEMAKECQQKNGSNCETKIYAECEPLEERCFYADLCIGIPPSKENIEKGVVSDEIQGCEDDYNCSSGYCREFSDEVITEMFDEHPGFNKICLPPSECLPKCIEGGNLISDTSREFCCAGNIALDVDEGKKCVPIDSLSVDAPPGFKIDFNQNDCSGGVYEDVETTDIKNEIERTETKVRRNFRLLRALEFLWT